MKAYRARFLPALFGLALLCAFVLLGAVPAAAEPGVDDVAMIETNEGTKYYTNFPAAATAVEDNQTITLLKDTGLNKTEPTEPKEASTIYDLNNSNNYTIDLAGYTLCGLNIKAGTVTIKNGTLTYNKSFPERAVLRAGAGATVTLEKVTVKHTENGVAIDNTNNKITIATGSACYPPQADWATAKTVCVWDSSDANKLALIPETGAFYESLPDAVAAAVDNQTIVLLKDISKDGTKYYPPTNASYYTLDLNGHTCCALGVTKGNVTVKNGTLKSDSNAFNTFTVAQSATVTLENVTVKHTGGGVAIDNTNKNITIAANSACYPPKDDWATAKIVHVWDAAATDTALNLETGTVYKALTGDNGAVAKVDNNQTIVLLKDITASAMIDLNVDKSYTLDLNKKTVTYSPTEGNNVTLNISKGTVKIKNGTVIIAKKDGVGIQITPTATKGTLEALTVTASGDGSIAINAGGALEILSGTYTGAEDAVQTFSFDKSKATITAGHFICTADGTDHPGALFEFAAGRTTLSDNSHAVYMDSNKEITTTDFVNNTEATDVFIYEVIQDPTVPTAPTDLKVSPGDGNAAVSWTAAASWGSFPAWHYKLTYQEDGAADSETLILDAAATSATLSNLKKGTSYTLEVQAVNRSGDGTPSDEVSFTVPSGGGGGGGGGSTATSNVNTGKTEHGSVTIDKKSPAKGDTVTITTKPQAGYEVDKVTVTDKKGNVLAVTPDADGSYSFVYDGSPVEIAVTFKEVTEEPAPPTPSEPGRTDFGDVPADAWYEEAVLFVTEAGLFKGTDEGKFSPDATMTRGMLVTVLGRLAGIADTGGDASAFTDVDPAAYYASFVAWAAENGIVSGMGEDSFAPNGEITREQLAVMLYRYALWAKLDISVPDAELPAFSDAGAVSGWAVEAIQWAVAMGILNGRTDGTLDPGGTATRAEVAAMLMRFAALPG